VEQVAILGAAGKMGRGITELIALEEPKLLHLIDTDVEGLMVTKRALVPLFRKKAEKQIVKLRNAFPLVSNEEVIQAYVDSAMERIWLSQRIEDAWNDHWVFEAVVEDEEVKVSLLQTLKKSSTYFFSNTSSIPIAQMAKKAGIEGRLIGFHFYHSPPKQQVVELVVPQGTAPQLVEEALLLGKRLKKTLVTSADVPGFIGNGLWMRELQIAGSLVRELEKIHGREKAIAHVNSATQKWLLRPMGIFTLADHVGLSTCRRIGAVMGVEEPLIAEYEARGFHPELIEGPSPPYTWKELSHHPLPLQNYFHTLAQATDGEPQIAYRYLQQFQKICENLIQQKVVANETDLAAILKGGFHHLYTPREVLG